ncbi:MAG TPA: IPT/TIG domain-containing protein [Puia sp.]|uniref:IPT/TIG domain-containing protein n=1 Tax=Puia sp. TaxID=2045100 RepID=UPI002C74A971|nr:IPT/TIG domain-containing protein [Puia sp.]HVU98396.1 IPT/TIG domain-containing protein [Puia sp.]
MKKTFLLSAFAVLLALASTAQIPANAARTPQGKIAANPTVKPAAMGKPNLTSIKLAPGMTRKLVLPPVLAHPPGLIQGEQTITGVIPSEGPRATAITISGTKFGSVQSDVQVKVNGVAAIVTAMSDNQIQCVVPDRCGSGPITVGVKGKWSSGGYFIYDWAARFTTFAGASGVKGDANGSGGVARFHSPTGMCKDPAGNFIVADQENNSIRKVNSFGEVTTLAGGGGQGYADGQGAAAKFYYPGGVACDNAGNVYVADTYNNRIRKIAPNGVVTTLAGSGQAGSVDGRGTAATFERPQSITFDGTYLYVYVGSKRRKIDMAGNVTTVPSTGATGILISSSREVYVNSGVIGYILPGGQMRPLAGNPHASGMVDGYGEDAQFSAIGGLTADGTGTIYVTDFTELGPNGNMTLIRRVGQDGMVTTPSDQMRGYNSIIWSPGPMLMDNSGALYLADRAQQVILKITLQ